MNDSLNQAAASDSGQQSGQSAQAQQPKNHLYVEGNVRVVIAPINGFDDLAEVGAKVLDVARMDVLELSAYGNVAAGVTASGALALERGGCCPQQKLLEGMAAQMAAIAMLCAEAGIGMNELVAATRQELQDIASKELSDVVVGEMRDRGLA